VFTRLLHQFATIERETSATFDAYGNEVTTLEVVDEDVPCRLQEQGSAEDTDERDTVTRTAVAFFDPSADLSPFDRITVDGETWEVVGQPLPRHDATGLHHYEVSLRWVQL